MIENINLKIEELGEFYSKNVLDQISKEADALEAARKEGVEFIKKVESSNGILTLDEIKTLQDAKDIAHDCEASLISIQTALSQTVTALHPYKSHRKNVTEKKGFMAFSQKLFDSLEEARKNIPENWNSSKIARNVDGVLTSLQSGIDSAKDILEQPGIPAPKDEDLVRRFGFLNESK